MTHHQISNEKIPNNVDLQSDKRLLRALEHWQPEFLAWWLEMGPEGFQANDVYLRTAISVDASGWASFNYVKMPDYRWGIFLAQPESDRRISCGDDVGQAVWQTVPGEHRNALRRLIVTQADTEPASIEQQRNLGATCPSLYDLRNLFQVNVEEGRHLWAMVYLLHSFFGRDGREEAEALLARRSGNINSPRILSTFNEPIEDWLSFFMFATFTDRDGKFQLLSLAESGFDPLSRTCRFMLTEEAHHLFVGQTGVQRVIRRSAELIKQHDTLDVAKYGGIPLYILQKYINFWYSSSLDLFGSEKSSNAANYFAAGLKGRPHEARDYEDHVALELRTAMNEVIQTEYIKDCEKVFTKWNEELEKHGLKGSLYLPSRKFGRTVGMFSQAFYQPDGSPISETEWNKSRGNWLPVEQDHTFVKSLMQKVIEPGKVAGWIAAPPKGINGQPTEYEYVKL